MKERLVTYRILPPELRPLYSVIYQHSHHAVVHVAVAQHTYVLSGMTQNKVCTYNMYKGIGRLNRRHDLVNQHHNLVNRRHDLVN